MKVLWGHKPVKHEFEQLFLPRGELKHFSVKGEKKQKEAWDSNNFGGVENVSVNFI